MNSKLVIVLVVQFMLADAPLNRQAAALERDQVPVQQCILNPKPSPDCLNHRDTSRVKHGRQALLRHQGRIRSMPPQSDLLQELLPPRDRSSAVIQMKKEQKAVHRISYRKGTQESGLLEELSAEISMP